MSETIELARPLLERHPGALADLVAALPMWSGRQEIVVTGGRPDLVAEARRRWLPAAVLAWGEPDDGPLFAGRPPKPGWRTSARLARAAHGRGPRDTGGPNGGAGRMNANIRGLRCRHRCLWSAQTIIRKELLRAAVGPRSVSTVDVREIAFAPGQQTGRHSHPCTVIGYIAEGAAILQIEGREPQSLPTGAAFREPAQTVIARFDNASQTEHMKFIACYLLTADEPLIEMLSES